MKKKIIGMELSRSIHANQNHLSLDTWRSASSTDEHRKPRFYYTHRGYRRPQRIMALFIAWLQKCGETL